MTRQSGMSQREQQYLQDIMGTMQVSSTKYQFYASQCRNSEIRSICQHVAQHQQDDLQQLRSMYNQGGGQLQ